MAVRVRLTRVGSKKNPIWRVVVADGRSPRDGRVIETIGQYNPQTQPSRIVIDRERLRHWLDRGAQPTNTVRKLMRAENTGLDKPPAPAPAAAVAVPQAEVQPEAEGDAAAAPEATPEAEAPAEGEGAAENEAGEAGPGEEPPTEEAPAGEAEVAADESAAPADADESP